MALLGAALGLAAAPTVAGPPYLTDDPVPTDTGHWEIYLFTGGEGFGSTFEGESGLDLNYGPVKDVQLTGSLPLAFSHEPQSGWRSGTGDVELGVKYRFVHDDQHGFSAAIFPRVILATSSIGEGEKTRLLLPLWLEKDFAGGTSLFGGGGYEVNPGRGNRDFWLAAVALTHDVSETLSVGGELTRQGPDTVDGTAQTRAGVGAIIKLGGPSSLLMSGGPTWADHRTGYHFYAALGLNF
ncbi:MAG TPA: hypothetical protein VIV07_11045 [Sphingomicrobium sp.]